MLRTGYLRTVGPGKELGAEVEETGGFRACRG